MDRTPLVMDGILLALTGLPIAVLLLGWVPISG
jgi:hypothetical protein